MTKEMAFVWFILTEKGVATDNDLEVACDAYGYNMDTLLFVLRGRTGFGTLNEYLAATRGKGVR